MNLTKEEMEQILKVYASVVDSDWFEADHKVKNDRISKRIVIKLQMILSATRDYHTL